MDFGRTGTKAEKAGDSMETIEVLKDLVLTEAVSGYEKKMAYKLKAYLEGLADDVSIDRAGNVIAGIKGSGGGPVVMIFAHMDQLGFIVRKIESSGLIQVDRLGGIPEKVLPALNVSVGTINGDYVPGVIGNKSHHATSAEEKYKVDLVTSLYIDVGAKSRGDVEKAGIRIGCPICYAPSFSRLMGTIVSGTSIDNRGGCAALVGIAEILRKKRPTADVYLVGTVWEEFNLRGALFAARKIKPDIAICLDVSLSGDTPDLSGRFEDAVSKGPTVSLYNFHGRGTLNGTIAHQGLYRFAMATAEGMGIKLQEFAALGMLTDTAYVQLEDGYVACLDMGFPARYTHTPIETCDAADIDLLAALVSAMAAGLDGGFQLARY